MKKIIFSICVFFFVCNRVGCLRIPPRNDIFNYDVIVDEGETLGPKIVIELSAKDLVEGAGIWKGLKEGEEKGEEEGGEEEGEEGGEEEGIEETLPGSEVDEETISKAEKMADEDLLKGLNRILKNNETLEDVFEAENIREFL